MSEMRERLIKEMGNGNTSYDKIYADDEEVAEYLISNGWVHLDCVEIDEEKVNEIIWGIIDNTSVNECTFKELIQMIIKAIAEARPFKVRGE